MTIFISQLSAIAYSGWNDIELFFSLMIYSLCSAFVGADVTFYVFGSVNADDLCLKILCMNQ